MYHFGDWYYLMVAEGGTEYGHMVTYARSKDPYGPFEAYAENPVLTNRNLGGNENHIQGIGHGDLITIHLMGKPLWYVWDSGSRATGCRSII